jgi:hypothetical protein
MWSGLYRHHLIGFVGIVGHFPVALSPSSTSRGWRRKTEEIPRRRAEYEGDRAHPRRLPVSRAFVAKLSLGSVKFTFVHFGWNEIPISAWCFWLAVE